MDRDSEIKLILEVESYKCLYDKTCADYKNKYIKNRAWMEIAAILQKPVAECQRKWTNLRDSFRQYFKAQNVPSGSSASKKVKWVHFDALKFLVPFVETPRTISNFESESSESALQVTIDSVTDEDLQIIDENIPLSSSNGKKRSRQRRNMEGTDENFQHILKAIENGTEHSAIVTFFMSLGKQAEALSRPQQLLLQQKCLQALSDLEMPFEF